MENFFCLKIVKLSEPQNPFPTNLLLLIKSIQLC